MSGPKHPLDSVVPIISARADGDPTPRFLGTGFFVRDGHTIMTAGHVFTDAGVLGSEVLSVNVAASLAPREPGGPSDVAVFRNVFVSEQFDVAVGQVIETPSAVPLALATQRPPIDIDVQTIEYSRSGVRDVNGSPQLRFVPQFRKGYQLCWYESTFPERFPTHCVDLSYPALKGASGSPVMSSRDGTVLGMVVCNVERDLLPAQLETVLSGDDLLEERKYFLPYAKAISFVHLAEVLEHYDAELQRRASTDPTEAGSDPP